MKNIVRIKDFHMLGDAMAGKFISKDNLSLPSYPLDVVKKTKLKIISKQSKGTVIAQQGITRFLVDIGNDKGVVVDMAEGKAYNSFNIHSILARGYWEEYVGNNEQDILKLL